MENNRVIIRLKGHEKFVLREGWLNKGIQVISKSIEENGYSRIFLGDNGTDELGVGSNMVKSIRYWLKAFGLTEESPGKGVRLSSLGKLILQYDPYFEDINTLWLLHSIIARNADNATTWYLFFNYCDIEEFTKNELELILNRELKKYYNSDKYANSSLKDDIDVLLNMYCKERASDFDPEDKNICPLSDLGLIKKVKDDYHRVQADMSKLHDLIILYELCNLFGNESNINIERIVMGENGLSKIYHLSNVIANAYLDKLEYRGYIQVNRTAGLDMVYLTHGMKQKEIIEEYYKNYR